MTTALASKLETVIRVGNSTCMYKVLKCIEIICAVQEKGSTFRKVQAEGIINIQLWPIRFDLGKIRIERCIQIQVLSNSPTNVQAAFGIYAVAVPIPCAGSLRSTAEVVMVGMISRFLLCSRSAKPSIFRIWQRKQETSKSLGLLDIRLFLSRG